MIDLLSRWRGQGELRGNNEATDSGAQRFSHARDWLTPIALAAVHIVDASYATA